MDIDWESLERKPDNGEKKGFSIKVPVKKVAVPKDKVRRLPDGTIVIREEDMLND